MALCDDIMWMIGDYVETYRINKKTHDLLNIIMRPKEIDALIKKYDDMKVTDLKTEYQSKMGGKDHYGFNTDGRRRKCHYVLELISYDIFIFLKYFSLVVCFNSINK